MNIVALDTNVVSKIFRGDTNDIQDILQRVDVFFIPWAVHGELLAGIRSGSDPMKYGPVLEDFLKEGFVIKSDTCANDTVPFYAEIYVHLRQNGTPVSPNDLWIAAECAQRGLPLLTLDNDFDAIKQVLRFR